MKLRHSAALALAGWYLMAPPASSDPLGGVDLDAPLAKWNIAGPHDTAVDCSTMQINMIKIAKSKFAANPSRANKIYGDAILSSQCMATDDPRLKEKQVCVEQVKSDGKGTEGDVGGRWISRDS